MPNNPGRQQLLAFVLLPQGGCCLQRIYRCATAVCWASQHAVGASGMHKCYRAGTRVQRPGMLQRPPAPLRWASCCRRSRTDCVGTLRLLVQKPFQQTLLQPSKPSHSCLTSLLTSPPDIPPQGAGGVAVVSPPSLSTDLGDDPMRTGASPDVSRSDASDRQAARSGRSVDTHSLQGSLQVRGRPPGSHEIRVARPSTCRARRDVDAGPGFLPACRGAVRAHPCRLVTTQ